MKGVGQNLVNLCLQQQTMDWAAFANPWSTGILFSKWLINRMVLINIIPRVLSGHFLCIISASNLTQSLHTLKVSNLSTMMNLFSRGGLSSIKSISETDMKNIPHSLYSLHVTGNLNIDGWCITNSRQNNSLILNQNWLDSCILMSHICIESRARQVSYERAL